MSFTNHTPNYNLPQYVGTDKPTFLGDFNNAMSAIDTALHNNEQNAGEGLSELQQAQAELTETQETLTEVQTEVANVSGIAATVNQNVQQALTAANDATTAANSATSQIQPAVTAANQASADAQAAQQVANGNVTTLNQLSERVTALENSVVTEITGNVSTSPMNPNAAGSRGSGFTINAPSGTTITGVELNFKSFEAGRSDSNYMEVLTQDSTSVAKYTDAAPPSLNTPIDLTPNSGTSSIKFQLSHAGQQGIACEFDYTITFEKS